MKGTLYGVGVGPGNPELMTLAAVRIIRESAVIACPGKDARQSTAYRIAVQAEPSLATKELLAVDMPMTRDRAELTKSFRQGALLLESFLKQGKDVAFLTLGDPAVYSTFAYLEERIAGLGYPTGYISGVPSFCAAAAEAGVPLTEWDEALHIIPAGQMDESELEETLRLSGTCALMKSGTRMDAVKSALAGSGREVYMVENCGMLGQKIYRGADSIPDTAGYFSMILAKEEKGSNQPSDDLSEGAEKRRSESESIRNPLDSWGK